MPMMNVYFTVDTESSIGSAWHNPERRPVTSDRHIFCRIGDRDHGVGLITHILQRNGFQGTFFVETLATLVNGDQDTSVVFDYLLEQNQDVQLHAHPVYRFYAQALKDHAAKGQYPMPDGTTDLVGAYAEERQLDLLGQATEAFRRLTGRAPKAFRAGCYGANRTTLRCLRKLGMTLDTSFNPCYPEWSFANEQLAANQVHQLEGVWELPVAVARTPLPESATGLKMADPCSLSVTELRTMLEAAAGAGQQHFVIVFHSFSAVKPRDGDYTEIRPDRIVIRRLEGLFSYLARHPKEYRVSTFGDAAGEAPPVESAPGVMANLPMLPAALRKFVQAANRYYWL